MYDDDVYFGLGSNLGDRVAHLRAGLAGLQAGGLRLRAVSSFYLTEPDLRPTSSATAVAASREGVLTGANRTAAHDVAAAIEKAAAVTDAQAHPHYINCVASFESDLGPRALLDMCLAVEVTQGRRRAPADPPTPRPRTLDIDLLLVGQTVVDEPGLTVPHPLMMQRRFVLEPLAEIAPTLHHPLVHDTMREALAKLPAGNGVSLLQPQPEGVD